MPLSEQEPIFLEAKDAVLMAGLSVRAIYRAIHRGDLGAVGLCSRIRIPRDAFEEWVERSRVVPEPPTPLEAPPRFSAARQGSFRRLLSGEEHPR